MGFPSDIKNAMRDCLLKILWAKDDIVDFFSDNGCTSADISILGNYKELSRAKIIDLIFNCLASKTDGGLGQFRAMLDALLNWSHFDSYYFDKLKKLNRDEAQRAIVHLKQLQEIRDHKIRAKREQREKRKRKHKTQIKHLKN